MSTLEFLSRLREQEIKVWAEGDRLRYSAPEGRLTPELRAEMVRRKGEILALLQRSVVTASSIRPVQRPPRARWTA